MTIRLPVGQPLAWNEAAIALLGTVSDRAVAKLLGINPKTAQAKRRALGIAPWRQPKRVLEIVCVIDGKITKVVGRRKSRLRKTCPNPHPMTRPGPSECEKQLRAQTLMLTHHNQPLSARGLVKKPSGMSFIR
jgi:hypothetical protein